MPVQSRIKSARRTGSPKMDAISLLKKDHQEVRKLLKQLESSTEGNGKLREDLLAKIETEIKAHTTIEEEIFYPAYRDAVRSNKDKELYYEALEEHHVVDMVMPVVKDTDVKSVVFAARAKVLKDLIEHHADEEEKEMFPKARKVMGTDELRELGQRMQQRKMQLMGKKTGQETGTLSKLLGRFGGNGGRKRAA